MFKVGDKVVDIYKPDEVGVVRAKYRHHYLVSFPGPKWRSGIRHEREGGLLSIDSSLLLQVMELWRKEGELYEEGDGIRDQITKLVKEGKR